MPDEEENKCQLIDFALESAEKRIESQLSAALAADARALGFSGISLAAAAILTGLAANSANATSMLGGAVLLVAASCISGWAARPVGFYMPGARFDDFEDDLVANTKLEHVKTELGAHFDTSEKDNECVLAKNANLVRVAFFVAAFGLLFAVAPQFASKMGRLPDASPTTEVAN